MGPIPVNETEWKLASSTDSDHVVVHGTMKDGIRHGLWEFIGAEGGLVELDLFSRGCLIGRVLPYRSPDDRIVEELRKQRGQESSARP